MALTAMELWEWLKRTLAGEEPIPSDEEPRDPEDPYIVPHPVAVRSIGAWCGTATLASPSSIRRDVSFAADLGLRRLDVMVNDFSKARSQTPFTTYTREKIVDLCHAAAARGIDVHLTSWLMPHATFIRKAAEELTSLMIDTQAKTVIFDAEEPWTQANNAMTYENAAALVDDLCTGKFEWGVTGIGFADSFKIGPLVRRASFMVPQCYTTSSSKLDPARGPATLIKRWRTAFGDHRVVCGLASYRQSGIAGYSIDAALRAAYYSAESSGVEDVSYWSLSAIRTSSAVAKTIRVLCDRTRPQPNVS